MCVETVQSTPPPKQRYLHFITLLALLVVVFVKALGVTQCSGGQSEECRKTGLAAGSDITS